MRNQTNPIRVSFGGGQRWFEVSPNRSRFVMAAKHEPKVATNYCSLNGIQLHLRCGVIALVMRIHLTSTLGLFFWAGWLPSLLPERLNNFCGLILWKSGSTRRRLQVLGFTNLESSAINRKAWSEITNRRSRRN